MNFLMEISLPLTTFLLLLFYVPAMKSQVTFSISTSAKVGDSAQFLCNATTTTPSNVQYNAKFKNETTKIATAVAPGTPGNSTPNTSAVRSGNLVYYKYTIDSLSCSDRGRYTCEVEAFDGLLGRQSETLIVLGPAGTPNLTAPTDKQILDETISIFCESSVGNPAQELKLCVGTTCATPEAPVEQADQCIYTQSASITFKVTKQTTTATCTVGSSSLQETQTWEVYCPAGTPNLTAPSDNQVLDETISIFCESNVGNPPQELKLCVDSLCATPETPVEQADQCSYRQKASLTFKVTKQTTMATCTVGSSSLQETQTWEVYYPVDSIMFIPERDAMGLARGTTQSYRCQALGKPEATIMWQFFPQNSQQGQIFQTNSIILDSQTSGVYVCTAKNTIHGITYDITKKLIVTVFDPPTSEGPSTPDPDTTTQKSAPPAAATSGTQKIIIGVIVPIIIIIIVIVFIILYKRRAKSPEIEEPPEKPRNNHTDVNMMNTKPDLVHSTGIEKKVPMYNNGFDRGGEDDLRCMELAFDDKPRSRKPVVPLPSSDSFDALPCV